MKIYFVRHGHPNYEKDCLTDLGKKQAKKAAERLVDSGITQIFASTKGRALETAAYTAEVLGLPVVGCDFMREISWHAIPGAGKVIDAHPWNAADNYVLSGEDLTDVNWSEKDPFRDSVVMECVDTVVAGFDAFMAGLGYEREGDYYRVTGTETDKTIAIFSHGGSSSAVMSHLLNIPFPQVCGFLQLDFTSITIFELSGKIGTLTYPKLVMSNDARHIQGITVGNVFES